MGIFSLPIFSVRSVRCVLVASFRVAACAATFAFRNSTTFPFAASEKSPRCRRRSVGVSPPAWAGKVENTPRLPLEPSSPHHRPQPMPYAKGSRQIDSGTRVLGPNPISFPSMNNTGPAAQRVILPQRGQGQTGRNASLIRAGCCAGCQSMAAYAIASGKRFHGLNRAKTISSKTSMMCAFIMTAAGWPRTKV